MATGSYTCDELIGYGYDCAACEAEGICDAAFTCPDGEEVDAPEDCSSCAFDWTDYGAESCDAAWDAFGIDCATLEAAYGWNCAGCECPGDGTDPVGCAEGEFDCNGDGSECIPGSYYCDGSLENGNAGWGADCSNGADEILEECCAAEASAYAGSCDSDPGDGCPEGTNTYLVTVGGGS